MSVISNLKSDADKGILSSVYKYAMMLYKGKNKEEAEKYFKIGADKGHIKCMILYEEIHEYVNDINISSKSFSIPKVKQMQIKKLYKDIISGNRINLSNEIESILNNSNINEIDILKFISNDLKITPNNVITILNNSNGFDELQEACEFYLILIERSEIKQQNFINIMFLNHLLENLNASNHFLYSIYVNIFLKNMDLESFYRITVTHCLRRPKLIYEIACFIKECYNFHKDKEIIKKTVCNYFLRFICKWEIHTLECFLNYFKLIDIKLSFNEKSIKFMKKQIIIRSFI